MDAYRSFLEKGQQAFDPLDLTEQTQKLVSQGSSRKYTSFYCVGVYGGISTGYLVGCNLRCAFCWVDWSRDFPQKMGSFYSAQEAFDNLRNNARKRRIKKWRISGGEPTLCRKHLLELLKLVEQEDCLFILESNGLLIGQDKEYARELSRFKKAYLRISLKAGTAEGFQQRTGALGKYFELPYRAISYLMEFGAQFHVACMSDERLMPRPERKDMIMKLKEIGYDGYLEEERCDPYPSSITRLQKAGFTIF